MPKNFLKEIITEFNLTKNEGFVLDTLFAVSETKVIPLARKTSLPRQTLYSLLNRLGRLGLVMESRVGRVKLYSSNIETIENALLHKKNEIEKSIIKFKEEKEKIKKESVENQNQKIAIYKGKLGVSYILNEMTKTYSKNKAKTFRAYTMSQFKEGFEEDFKKFVETRNESNIESRIFVPKGTDFTKIMGFNKYKREFKVLDMEDFGCALYIVGNKTYLVSYRDNEGFIIENQNLAMFLKEIFDIHWKSIK